MAEVFQGHIGKKQEHCHFLLPFICRTVSNHFRAVKFSKKHSPILLQKITCSNMFQTFVDVIVKLFSPLNLNSFLIFISLFPEMSEKVYQGSRNGTYMTVSKIKLRVTSSDDSSQIRYKHFASNYVCQTI